MSYYYISDYFQYFMIINVQSVCTKNNFYRISVTVFYDDEYKKELGSRAESHIQNAMGMVEEMYTEFKKWNTMMEIDLKEIKHVRDRWVRDRGGRFHKRW